MTQPARNQHPQSCPGPRWYAVRTKPRQESRARANLENQGFAVYLPHTWLDRRKAGRWQRVREVLFPGYLFIAVDTAQQATAPIRSTPGVLGLVRQGIEPLPVADAIIEQLRAAEATLEEGNAPPQPFQPGDPLTKLDRAASNRRLAAGGAGGGFSHGAICGQGLGTGQAAGRRQGHRPRHQPSGAGRSLGAAVLH